MKFGKYLEKQVSFSSRGLQHSPSSLHPHPASVQCHSYYFCSYVPHQPLFPTTTPHPTQARDEWRTQYLDYKGLKDLIKESAR